MTYIIRRVSGCLLNSYIYNEVFTIILLSHICCKRADFNIQGTLIFRNA